MDPEKVLQEMIKNIKESQSMVDQMMPYIEGKEYGGDWNAKNGYFYHDEGYIRL